MSTLPYSPTTVLSSPTSAGLFYIFRPAPGSSSSELLSLNTTSTLNSGNVPFTTITPSLPFLKDEQDAYIPVIDSHGTILVYSGECGDSPRQSGLWSLSQPKNPGQETPQWQQLEMSSSGVDDAGVLYGTNHLASGIAFSTIVNSTASMYIFGGMCPNSTSLTADTWTQAAAYSNAMLSLQPSSASSSAGITAYQLDTTSSRGPPIPEAGFSMTPLDSTFSSSSDNASQSQNQNFVLIGGHTQTAFINMSQIALFSLPEQSWSFLPVDLPDVHKDLVRRDPTNIDSRSGHTALLTSDGTRIIVYGGWVGDVSQPADPQLAIVELGAGYGGAGDWQWKVPSVTGPGPAGGTGLYGHGAAMLPGDVMMIIGGNSIPSVATSRRKRQLPVASSSTFFLNISSNTWITSYDPPTGSQQDRTNPKHTSNQAAKRAGLGAGLTLGVLIIIAAVVIYFWYSKRLKRTREKREDDLRILASGAEKHLVSGPRNHSTHEPEMTTVSQPEHVADPKPIFHHQRAEPQAERTGLLFEIPSPTRGLRRSLHSRGIYQPAPRFDNGRRTPDFSNTIHPIDERDEYEEDLNPSNNSGEEIHKGEFDLLSNVPVLDPFRDPDRSRSPSPQSPQQRELEVRRWVDDWTAAEILMQQQADRLSPEKTDRTSSTLSDQSARSLLSSVSWQPSAGTVSRTMSQRSAALLNVLPFKSTHDTPLLEVPGHHSSRAPPEHRRSNSWRLQSGAERSAETPTSFLTAQTSHPAKIDASISTEDEPSATTLQGRARGIMGSLRRVLIGDRAASTSPEHSSSASSSPTKSRYHESETMQRDTSTGGAFWRARQGAKDWDAEGKRNDNVRAAADEEWDVESAVQNRVVQVMFTVPKDKLRVVNRGDEDRESILSSKDNSVAAEEGDRVSGQGERGEP